MSTGGEGDSQSDLFGGPESKRKPKPRSTAAKAAAAGYSRAAAERLWAVQNLERAKAAERLGKRKPNGLVLTDTGRKLIAQRFAEGFTESQLAESQRNRAASVTKRDWKYFNGTTNWRSANVQFALANPPDATDEAPGRRQKWSTGVERAEASIEARRAELAEMNASPHAEAYRTIIAVMNAERTRLRQRLKISNGLGPAVMSRAWTVRVDAELAGGRTVDEICEGVEALGREVEARARKGDPNPTKWLTLNSVGKTMWSALSRYPAQLDKEQDPDHGFAGLT